MTDISNLKNKTANKGLTPQGRLTAEEWNAVVAAVEEVQDLNPFERGQGEGSVQLKDADCAANGDYSHAEGQQTTASGDYSHAEGRETATSNDGEHAEGLFNISHRATPTHGDAGNTIHSIGIGTKSARKNAVEVMQNGDTHFYGIGGYDGTNPLSGENDLKTVISHKADKVLDATNGNLASLDANGNIQDSGKKASDFADNAFVPNQASVQNQLADKAFVNSSVQTATANFRGNYSVLSNIPTNVMDYPEDYAGSTTPTTNDYLVVADVSPEKNEWTDEIEYFAGNVVAARMDDAHPWHYFIARVNTYNNVPQFNELTGSPVSDDYWESLFESDYDVIVVGGTWRFKYTGDWDRDGVRGWIPEYQVNEKPLTAAQLAAINSGITSSLVVTIPTKYTKPVGGIPANDLAQDVQYSLEHADSAYEGMMDKADKVDPAIPGNFAGLDSNGNLTDSGRKASDFVLKTNSPFESGDGDNSAVLKNSGSKAIGQNSVAIGTNTIAYGKESNAKGFGNRFTVEILNTIGKTYTYRNTAYDPRVGDVIEYNDTYTYITEIDTTLGTITLNDSIPATEYTSVTIVRGVAYGESSSVEGRASVAIGLGSHAEGSNNVSYGQRSHAEGNTNITKGAASHAEGHINKTNNRGEHAEGNFNVSHKASSSFGSAGNTTHSVGIGTSESNRMNAFEIMQNGEIYICGVGGYDGTNPSSKANSLQKVLENLGITIDWTKLGY